MGDRCSVRVNVHRDDLEAFCGLVPQLGSPSDYFDHEDATLGHLACSEADEVNYAANDDRNDAACAGLRFTGTHGDGCEYDGASFAAYDGVLYEVIESKEGGLMVRIDHATGEPYPGELRNARDYITARNAVEGNQR